METLLRDNTRGFRNNIRGLNRRNRGFKIKYMWRRNCTRDFNPRNQTSTRGFLAGMKNITLGSNLHKFPSSKDMLDMCTIYGMCKPPTGDKTEPPNHAVPGVTEKPKPIPLLTILVILTLTDLHEILAGGNVDLTGGSQRPKKRS